MHAQPALKREAAQNQFTTSKSAIDVVREVYDAYTRQDLGKIISLYHPECELFQTEQLPWGGRYRGHSGIQHFFQRLTTAIETRIEDEQLMEADDRVVSIGYTRGRVRRSGAAINLPAVHVYTVADGLIRGYEAYVDTPGMLRALAAD